MSTSISTTTPYCTAAQFIQRYDVRSIGDRLLDDGTRATATAALDPTTIAGANLLSLLLQGAGMIETAVMRGERYLLADLQAVITANAAGSEYLKGLNADVTLWLVYNRRPMPGVPVPLPAQNAMSTLELLSGGQRIFALDTAADAGVDVEIVSPDPDNPQITPLSQEPLTTRTQDYFGDRSAG